MMRPMADDGGPARLEVLVSDDGPGVRRSICRA